MYRLHARTKAQTATNRYITVVPAIVIFVFILRDRKANFLLSKSIKMSKGSIWTAGASELPLKR